MILTDLPATVYATQRGFAVTIGGFVTRADAQAVVDDANALFAKGVFTGRENVLDRLRARGAGYAVVADEIETELRGARDERNRSNSG